VRDEILEGLRGRGEAAGNAHARGGKLADELPEGSVLSADRRDVRSCAGIRGGRHRGKACPIIIGHAQPQRVFFISDRTGITVEGLGSSLLSQFGDFDFQRVTLPFVDTVEKAREIVEQVNQANREGTRPLVFSSIVNDAVRER
jgi:hypothetical protein